MSDFNLTTPNDAVAHTFGGDSLHASGGIFFYNATGNSTITVNNFQIDNEEIVNSSASKIFTLAGNLFVTNNNIIRGAGGAINVTANLSGNGSITLHANTATLTGNNTNFTGKIRVGNGMTGALSLSSEAQLGANPPSFTSDQFIFNRGWLYTTTSFVISNSNRGITIGVNDGIFDESSGTTLTLGCPLASGYTSASANQLTTQSEPSGIVAGVLIKQNSGTLALTSSNPNYNGAISINAGSLSIAGAGQLGGGSFANPFTDNAVFDYSSSAAQTVSSAIAGTGSITKNGSGTLTLSGANTLSGAVTVNNGILYANPGNAANNRAFSYVSGITINSGGTLQSSTNGLFGWDGTQEKPITVNSGGTLTCDSGADVGVGTVTLNGGTLANLGASAAYGSWRFDNSNSVLAVTDNSTVSAVNVKFANGGAINVSSGKTLNFTGMLTDATSGGASSVVFGGAGTAVFSGANTFTGSALLNAGRVILTNTATFASSNIVVASGATFDVAGLASTFTVGSGKALAGSGTNFGAVTTASGARIYAGTDGGYGTNRFSSNLTMVAGANLCFDLGPVATGANDQFVIAGNLNLNSTVIRIKAASNLDPTTDYLLATVSGTISGTLTPTPVWDVQPGNAGAFSAYVTNGNQIVLHAVSLPPTVTVASVSPASLGRNQILFMSAAGVPGTYSLSNYSANATSIGGPTTLNLVSDGGGNFTNSVAVSSATVIGTGKNIILSVTDSNGISGTTNFSITVVATNRVWNGGAPSDNNWSSNPNWSTSAAPGFIGDGIVFDGSTRLAPVMDTNYTATGVTFNSTAGSFTIGTTSSTLTLNGGITNNSPNAQTLNVPVTFTNSQTIAAASGNVTLGRALAIGTNTLTVLGASNATVSGAISGGGSLFKQGAGTMTISSNSAWGGVGATSGGFSGPLIAQSGGLTFNGGTATVTGELVIGGVVANGGAGNNAKIIVSNSTLNVSSWFSIGRGNGIGGVSSDLVLTNAATVTCSNLSAGFNGGSTANLPRGTMTLNNSATFTVLGNGAVNFAESAGSDITMTLTNTAQFIATGTAQEFLGEFGKGTVNLNGSSTMLLGTGGVNIGYRSGTGVVSVANSAVLRVNGELRVGGSDTSGTGNSGYGTVNLSGGTLNVGSLTVARGNDSLNGVAGDVYLTGGTFTDTNDVILGYAGTGRARLNMNGGTFNVGTTATKWLIMPFYDTTRAEINLTNGALNLNSSSSIKFSRGNTSTAGSPNIISQKGGTITFYSDFATTPGGTGALDLQYSGAATITNIYNLDGGTLTVPQIISSLATATRQFNFNSGTLKAAAASATFFNSGVASAANVRNGGAVIDTGANSVIIGQQLIHSTLAGDSATDGGLTKLGAGTLTLTAANTFSGITAIGAGALALAAGATLGTSVTIIVSNAATFDVSAAGYTLAAGRTLKGYGTVVGNVTSAGTISPGGSIGTLTMNNNVVMQPGGVVLMKISKLPTTNDQLRVLGSLTLGGTLTVTNLVGTLAANDSFQLFNAGSTSGTFGLTNLPPLNAGLGWNFNSASGVLSVVQTVATNPTNISYTIGGGNLMLTWPSDHTGWRLLMQTNNLAGGISVNTNDWTTVANSQFTNQMILPIDPTLLLEFYRLVYP
jgi:autotransporter-associated beta strand protein